MAETMTTAAVLANLNLEQSPETNAEFETSGIVPASIASAEIKKQATLLGITPEDFISDYGSTEFDFGDLKIKFLKYCRDFNHELQENKPSKALQFCAKILFEYGPYIRTERKGKGDKAIRFKFPYNKDGKLRIKVVIVTTFKDIKYTTNIESGKLLLTFRQAALLAMVTFSKAINYCYNRPDSAKLMSPLCGAIFSRDSLGDMARDLNIEEVRVLEIINESSTSGGQYLPSSDIACAIVCMISTTKKVTDKNIRNVMISKVVKQYIHKQKVYNNNNFIIFAKYALGGVPVGLDAETLISAFQDIQALGVSSRAKAMAIKQSEIITPSSETLRPINIDSGSYTILPKDPKNQPGGSSQ